MSWSIYEEKAWDYEVELHVQFITEVLDDMQWHDTRAYGLCYASRFSVYYSTIPNPV